MVCLYATELSEAESFTYGVTGSVAPFFSIGFRRTLSTSKNRIWEEGEVVQEKITYLKDYKDLSRFISDLRSSSLGFIRVD